MSQSTKFQINEIFYSLQGEGFWTGTPAVFVRFAGCNLSCSWCDTNYSCQSEQTAEEVTAEINQYPAPIIVLTGGEPLLQVNANLLAHLRKTGKRIHVETNGTIQPPKGIDWLTISPKGLAFWEVKTAQEIKIVYAGQDLTPFIEANCQHYFLQPCSMNNISETITEVKRCPQWRLSLQTHKILNIR